MSAPRRRPALIVLVIAAAVTCLALGWWQWNRFQSAGGTAQNLGYALQWPLFAGFFVYAYRRFVRLEHDREQTVTDPTAEPETAAYPAESTPPARGATRDRTEIPAHLLPSRPVAAAPERADPVLAEYNRYLAELNARDTNRKAE
jgi:DNA-binding transcriptional regulator of glucitol operon